MRTTLPRFSVTALSFTLLLAALPAVAADSVDGEISAEVDPQAEQVLRHFAALVTTLKTLSLDVSFTVEIETPSKRQEASSRHHFAAEPPGKFALIKKDGQIGRTLVCDGKEIVLYDARRQQYTVNDAPDTPDKRAAVLNVELPLLDALVHPKPYDQLLLDTTRVEYIGSEEYDGIDCHRIRLSEGDEGEVSVDLWIEIGDYPLPRKLVAFPPSSTPDSKTTVTALFENWLLNNPIPKSVLTFTPPEGADKVSAFGAARRRPTGARPSRRSPLSAPELGDMAPDVSLPLLDGGRMDLAAHRDQEVVILDFWATWCPPCRAAMPIIDKIAQEYESKGVEVYAVNLAEEKSKVRSFLRSNQLGLRAALDRDRTAGRSFRISSIPTTVIIGRDGTIQSMHKGYTSDLESRLREELDTLLSGGSLVTVE